MDNRQRMPSDGKSSHGLWQGELKKKQNSLKMVWFRKVSLYFVAIIHIPSDS
jgi:hypothetical protein